MEQNSARNRQQSLDGNAQGYSVDRPVDRLDRRRIGSFYRLPDRERWSSEGKRLSAQVVGAIRRCSLEKLWQGRGVICRPTHRKMVWQKNVQFTTCDFYSYNIHCLLRYFKFRIQNTDH